MQGAAKRYYYIRPHSNIVRRFNPHKNYNDDDQPIKPGIPLRNVTLRIMCRKKQRLLLAAWKKWVTNAQVFHDYTIDLRIILTRPRGPEEQLDEVEIEVLHKWVMQHEKSDPTGLACSLCKCRSKVAVVEALQALRLEQFEPGEGIIFQGTLPRPEDGLFTVLTGQCDVMLLPAGSMALLNLGAHFKAKDWDAAKPVLEQARLINTLHPSSGFGELASLALIKRTASVRASPGQKMLTELIVLPRHYLYSVLSHSGGNEQGVAVQSTSEAIDFLRQSGLGMSVSSRELFTVASSMRKRSIPGGSVLYVKNQRARFIYIVVSGEVIADLQYEPGANAEEYPYISSLPSNVFILSNGSMLGEEAFVGSGERRYNATVSVLSDTAVLFEVGGAGLDFLSEKLNSGRYSALAYKDQSPWAVPIAQADANSIYTMFNSLRMCIAESNPFRGTLKPDAKKLGPKELRLSELGMPTVNEEAEAEGKPVAKGAGRRQSGAELVDSLDECMAAGIAPWAQKALNDSKARNTHGHNRNQIASAGTRMLTTAGSVVSTRSYLQLPVTVMQYALKMKRDQKKEESQKIRELAKDSILHDELKKRGQQAAVSPLVSAKLETAQRQLQYNFAAFKQRCIESKENEEDAVGKTLTNSPRSRKKGYGVDFEIDVDDEDDLDSAEEEDSFTLESTAGTTRRRGGKTPARSQNVSPRRLSLREKLRESKVSGQRNIQQHHLIVEYNKQRAAMKEQEMQRSFAAAATAVLSACASNTLPGKAKGTAMLTEENLRASMAQNKAFAAAAMAAINSPKLPPKESEVETKPVFNKLDLGKISSNQPAILRKASEEGSSSTSAPIPDVDVDKLNAALTIAAAEYGVQLKHGMTQDLITNFINQEKKLAPARNASAAAMRRLSMAPGRRASMAPARNGSGPARRSSMAPARKGSMMPTRNGSGPVRNDSIAPARNGSMMPARNGSMVPSRSTGTLQRPHRGGSQAMSSTGNLVIPSVNMSEDSNSVEICTGDQKQARADNNVKAPPPRSGQSMTIRKQIPLRFTLTHDVPLDTVSAQMMTRIINEGLSIDDDGVKTVVIVDGGMGADANVDFIATKESAAIGVPLSPVRTRSPNSRVNSPTNSRCSPTFGTTTEETVEIVQRMQTTDAHGLLDLESPVNFMNAIRGKEFPVKRCYKTEREWATRFVQVGCGTGTSALINTSVGGSDGQGNDLKDGMPARNKSILYLDTMRATDGKTQTGNDIANTFYSLRKSPEKSGNNKSKSAKSTGKSGAPKVASGRKSSSDKADAGQPSRIERAETGEVIGESVSADEVGGSNSGWVQAEPSRELENGNDAERASVTIEGARSFAEEGGMTATVHFADSVKTTAGDAEKSSDELKRVNSGAGTTPRRGSFVAPAAEGLPPAISSTLNVSTDLTTLTARSTSGVSPSNASLGSSRKKQTAEEQDKTLAELNPGADALERLNAVIHTQKASSRYLDGKRKQAQNSRFRLLLPQEPDLYCTDPADRFMTKSAAAVDSYGKKSAPPDSLSGLAYTKKTMRALNECLQSPDALKARRHAAKMAAMAKERALKGADDEAGSGSPSYTLKGACYTLHKDEVLADWQEFCVGKVTAVQHGPHKSLPVLSRAQRSDRDTGNNNAPSSSSCRGKLVLMPSISDYDVKGPSSYLDLFTAKSHTLNNNMKQKHK